MDLCHLLLGFSFDARSAYPLIQTHLVETAHFLKTIENFCMSLHKWYTINRLLIALYQMIGDMQMKLRFLRKGRNMMQRVIDQRRLLTSVAKTLEHIIVSNINKHLAFEKNLADCQHGLRSPTEVLQNLNGSVLPWRGRGVNCCNRQTDVIIMDFAKAFDKVAHRGQ